MLHDHVNFEPLRGMQVEGIEDTTMREIRYLDKLIGELARGRCRTRVSLEVRL